MIELLVGIVTVVVIAVGRNVTDPKDTGYVNANFQTAEEVSMAE